MKYCSRCGQQPQQAKHAYCNSCQADYNKRRYRKQNAHKPRIQELETHGHRKSHPAYRMVQSARHRAKKKGLKFDLCVWDITVPDKCPVLGIPLDKRDLNHTPSLDRINPKKGYTKDNVCVISFRANSIKQDATKEELRLVTKYAST